MNVSRIKVSNSEAKLLNQHVVHTTVLFPLCQKTQNFSDRNHSISLHLRVKMS